MDAHVYDEILRRGREAQERFITSARALDAGLFNGTTHQLISDELDELAEQLGVERPTAGGAPSADRDAGLGPEKVVADSGSGES